MFTRLYAHSCHVCVCVCVCLYVCMSYLCVYVCMSHVINKKGGGRDFTGTKWQRTRPVCLHVRIYSRTHTHVYIHTYTHTHLHTQDIYTHTPTHTHTHAGDVRWAVEYPTTYALETHSRRACTIYGLLLSRKVIADTREDIIECPTTHALQTHSRRAFAVLGLLLDW